MHRRDQSADFDTNPTRTGRAYVWIAILVIGLVMLLWGIYLSHAKPGVAEHGVHKIAALAGLSISSPA